MRNMHDLQRHDLVRLTPAGWETALARLDGNAALVAARWRDRDLPAVVRRTDPGLPPDTVCLGLPALPDAHTGQKVRAGIAVARRHIASARPALALDEVLVPEPWRDAFPRLADAMRAAAIECRVFGSLAMQTLTGEPCVGPASDIDVLLRPASARQLDAGLDLLLRHARDLPLDGEIVFPSGHAVSWKEWAGVAGTRQGAAARVLAKHLDSVALIDVDALRRRFEDHADA